MGKARSLRRAARLEARRMRAIQLVTQGHSQAEVARRLDVSREAVRQWVDAWRAKGRAGLAARPRRKGARVEIARVGEILARARGRLTTERARAVIARDLGVAYCPSSVRAILRRLGYLYTRPLGWHRRAPAEPVALKPVA
jgi:transposase